MRVSRWLILVWVYVAMMFVPTVRAASITVTTTADENGTNAAACSLREAIASANTDAAFGGCTAGSGADTIDLPSGIYELTMGSDLSITSNVTIQATSGTTIVEASATAFYTPTRWRVFNVANGGSLNLVNLTIRHGRIPLLSFDPAQATLSSGGCIRVANGGVLVLNDTVVTMCSAFFAGGGVFGDVGSNVTISGGSITDNRAGDDGGGIRMDGGVLSIAGTTISNNQNIDSLGITSAAHGGGMSYSGTTLTITNAIISGNSTTDLQTSGLAPGRRGIGGGVYAQITSGTATISNTIISGNTATGSDLSGGGGLYKDSSGSLTITDSIIENNSTGASAPGMSLGGGIYLAVGGLTGVGTTIQNNSAADDGGGIYNASG